MSSFPNKSYLEAAGGGLIKAPLIRKRAIERNGETIIAFTADEVKKSIEPLKWALIGRFINHRPNIDDVRNTINSNWGLSANVSIGIFDSKHIIIRCNNESDYMKIWTKENISVKGIRFIVFPWRIDFDTSQEAFLQAVWVKFPQLPINFFNEDYIASIASGVGKYIMMDNATRCLTRPEWARVCIEIDTRKPLKREVFLDMGHSRRRQPVVYEHMPMNKSQVAGINILIKADVPSSSKMIDNQQSYKEKGVDHGTNKEHISINQRIKKGKLTESTKDWVTKVFYPKRKSRMIKVWRRKITHNAESMKGMKDMLTKAENSKAADTLVSNLNSEHASPVQCIPISNLVQGPNFMQVQGQSSTGRPTYMQLEHPIRLQGSERMVEGTMTGNLVNVIEEHDEINNVDLLSDQGNQSCILVQGSVPLEHPTCMEVKGQSPTGRPTYIQVQGLEGLKCPTSIHEQAVDGEESRSPITTNIIDYDAVCTDTEAAICASQQEEHNMESFTFSVIQTKKQEDMQYNFAKDDSGLETVREILEKGYDSEPEIFKPEITRSSLRSRSKGINYS